MGSTRFAVFTIAALASLAQASSALAATADHQQCFKIKDTAAATAYVADLVPTDLAFPVAMGCEVKARAKLLCIDVQKTNVIPSPPGADAGLPAQRSLCYKVKCPKLAAPITSTETDQFGAHAITVTKSSLLCVPIPAAGPGGCASPGDCSPLANATVACSAGACVIGSCNAGYFDCDSTASTGCELNGQSDPNNCNGCGTTCPAPANATAGCTAGTCGIDSCNAGFLDCDGMANTGCEANPQADPNNCGGCGTTCPAPAHATAGCTSSTCGIGSCNMGFLDCDGMSNTGCETNTQTDANNCGGCGLACPSMTVCFGGICF